MAKIEISEKIELNGSLQCAADLKQALDLVQAIDSVQTTDELVDFYQQVYDLLGFVNKIKMRIKFRGDGSVAKYTLQPTEKNSWCTECDSPKCSV